MGSTKAVTDATFDAEVLQSSKPVIVDYWAEWCGPCRQVAPVLEEIASEYGDKIEVVKLNIDENPNVSTRYKIMAIPTLGVFQNGEVVKQIVGAKPKAALLRDLAEYNYPHPDPPGITRAAPVSTGAALVLQLRMRPPDAGRDRGSSTPVAARGLPRRLRAR